MTCSLIFASFAPGFCFFGPVGGWELLIVLFLVLLFFGPKRLPEMAGAIGKSIQRFKKASREVLVDKDEIATPPVNKPTITEGKDKQG